MSTEKLKDNILSKSLSLFTSMGVKVVTMDDIAEGLAISKKTIYTVFPKKESIVKEVFDGMIRNMNKEVEEILLKKLNPVLEIRELHEIFIYYILEMNSPNILQTKKYYYGIYKYIEKNIWEILRDSFSNSIKRGIEHNIFRINILDDDNFILLYYHSLTAILTKIQANRKKIKNISDIYIFHFCRGISSGKGFTMIASEEQRLNF